MFFHPAAGRRGFALQGGFGRSGKNCLLGRASKPCGGGEGGRDVEKGVVGVVAIGHQAADAPGADNAQHDVGIALAGAGDVYALDNVFAAVLAKEGEDVIAHAVYAKALKAANVVNIFRDGVHHGQQKAFFFAGVCARDDADVHKLRSHGSSIARQGGRKRGECRVCAGMGAENVACAAAGRAVCALEKVLRLC